jgi:hypothetical protein
MKTYKEGLKEGIKLAIKLIKKQYTANELKEILEAYLQMLDNSGI